MSELTLGDGTSGFTTGCDLIGRGQRADCVWTKDQFIALCGVMMNSNPATHFMHVYRDDSGNAKFVKSKTVKVAHRIDWAWNSITGRARKKVGIGFYPCNSEGKSRWSAMDFDARGKREARRARKLAVAAFEVLRRNPNLYLVLEKSGSEGWHLFVYTEEFNPIAEWTKFLKQVASRIGAEIKTGRCEIFPSETRAGSLPCGIRAPGTWNPKTNQCGLIFFNSIGELLSRLERKKEECPFLYHSTKGANTSQLNDSAPFYCGGEADWQKEFEINQPGTRHAKLAALVHATYRQAGYRVGRRNAEAQYLRATVQPNATLAEHLAEFDELWAWTTDRWRDALSDREKERLDVLPTEVERELFRILLNFANFARDQGRADFPFPIQNVGDRIGVSFQHISKLRQRFVVANIIAQAAPAVPNRSAARFRWCGGDGNVLDSPRPRGND